MSTNNNIFSSTNVPSNDLSNSITDEVKEQNNKYTLSKFDYELFKDEDNIVEKIIRVKRISLPNKGEKWKFFDNGKVIFVLEGTKLTKKEKEFARSPEGVLFLIDQFKNGIKSLNALKKEIKKKIK